MVMVHEDKSPTLLRWGMKHGNDVPVRGFWSLYMMIFNAKTKLE